MNEAEIRQRLVEMSDGTLVESDVLRVVDKIREYDENLRVKYNPNPTSISDAPYRITEMCPDGIERIVMDVWELDDRVMQKLWAADTRFTDINLALDKANAKASADLKRRYKDLEAEAHDIANSVFKSSKDSYKLTDPHTGRKMTIHASRPVEYHE